MTPSHLLNLILDNGYYTRRFINFHPEVVAFLRNGNVGYIQPVEGEDDTHVIVWKCKEDWAEWEKSRIDIAGSKGNSIGYRSVLQQQLLKAIEENDFVTVNKIKQQMKESQQ